ncbi:MAG: hypothetical protein KDJ65_25795 [Anaerolineae bacterium]|nr:hypothetical protein [Anaerolineae bacterium]
MLLRLSLLFVAVGVVISVISASLLGVSVYFTRAGTASAERESVTIRQLAPLEDDRTTEKEVTPSTAGRTSRSTDEKQSTPQAIEPTDEAEILMLSGADDSVEEEVEVSSLAKGETAAAVVTPTVKATIPASLGSAVVTKTDVLTRITTPETITKTDVISLPTPTSTPTPTAEPALEIEADLEYNEPYTSTDQVQPPPSADPTDAPAVSALGCPVSSPIGFELIPIEGQPLKDHPAYVHGDLNLALRGYIPFGSSLGLVDYEGATDGDAPQLHGLFEPNRVPQFLSTYRVNDWVWDSSQCGGHPRGCPGPPADTFWPVTLVGVATTPGEPVHIPERGAQIYSGGYTALVLYAEENRITLGYTRRDTVAAGYTVHIENVCVNPNLVALYKAQEDADGWLASGHLPGLRNNQTFGTALGHEIQVAIRDAGMFMDPRSQKDWWR